MTRGQRHRPRRRADRRLHRHRSPGARARSTRLRGHPVGDVQRGLTADRPRGAAKRRLPTGRSAIAPPARWSTSFPGTEDRRNSETQCRTHRHRHGGARGRAARAARRRPTAPPACNFLFGGTHPRDGGVLRELPLRASAGAGAPTRRETLGGRARWRLPQHAVEVFESRYPFATLVPAGPRQRAAPAATAAGSVRARSRGARARADGGAPFDRRGRGLGARRRPGRGMCGHRRYSARQASSCPSREVFDTVPPAKFANVTVRAGDGSGSSAVAVAGSATRTSAVEDVCRDVRNDYVSVQRAADRYGVT